MSRVSMMAWLAAVAAVATAGVLPEGYEKNSPAFRGPAGTGLYPAAGTLPTAWNEAAQQGILWKAKLDLPGWASPVVWGDRVVVLGADAQKRQAACFDAATGKLLWKSELPKAEGATEEYTLNTQSDQWNVRMHAASTPATDGKRVFALFSNGQLAALELGTGKVVWTIGLGSTEGNDYGLASSLLVHGDSVIAVFEGETSFIAAYDAATGKEQWKSPRKKATWSSPILVRTTAGKPLVVLLSDPALTAWDPATGQVVWTLDVLTTSPEYCVGPTPVFADGMVVVNCEKNGIFGIDPDTGRKAWGLTALPDDNGFADGISMVADGKHVYQYFQAALTCVEARTGKLVKTRDMDDTASYASPLCSDGNLYLFGGGETVVLKADAAADFPAVGKGSLKETFEASPAAAGGRLFVRTDASLYAIGAK